jgi:hypothetical protein
MEFQQACQKLMNTPTSGENRYTLRKMLKPIKDAQKKIRKEYAEDIMNKFGKKGEDGKVDPETFQPEESKVEEFKAAQEEFGKRIIEIKRKKLTYKELADASLTANEEEALLPVFDDTGGVKPPMPLRRVN